MVYEETAKSHNFNWKKLLQEAYKTSHYSIWNFLISFTLLGFIAATISSTQSRNTSKYCRC